ncbi:hypothetical protein TraAM80_04362 [Trypanosoma rangeli]|uniref:Uncharacterized protein n=1 Tax=Trypanosoma rangeli TaxID=5698 RepID=A0A422NJS3_TRYRA|nr:uncharacterized protein TraAM80_04362 [Trypanosoma rangeli]RNF05727.1 hypothetical protein TraAM80_04362 [Trypanosoma rangeli]|eukprot:RNF05727.1 hypothetical protein TraAM80_04362 [Trypanosoma rangeli]
MGSPHSGSDMNVSIVFVCVYVCQSVWFPYLFARFYLFAVLVTDGDAHLLPWPFPWPGGGATTHRRCWWPGWAQGKVACATLLCRCLAAFFYAGLDESHVRRPRRAGATFNKPRGRDALSLAFERRVRVLPLLEVGELYAPPAASSKSTGSGDSGAAGRPLRVLVVELLSLGDVEAVVPYPALYPTYYAGWTDEHQSHPPAKTHGTSPFLVRESGRTLQPINKMQLRQNGDTSLLRGFFTRRSASHDPTMYAVALCIDPFLDLGRFRREEAQVELICGYRNVLYEASELPGVPADVVRIPALSCDTCGENLRHELGKLSQQALIKGFHRISNEAKESLILNPHFRVEMYVSPRLLEQFERTFLEDAWEAPESTINLGRTALYPGLPHSREHCRRLRAGLANTSNWLRQLRRRDGV